MIAPIGLVIAAIGGFSVLFDRFRLPVAALVGLAVGSALVAATDIEFGGGVVAVVAAAVLSWLVTALAGVSATTPDADRH